MNELEFKKKMKHLLEINTELYKENQKLKKYIEELQKEKGSN
jgi:regulator of replication initiation timing